MGQQPPGPTQTADSVSVARWLSPAGTLAAAYEALWESLWTQRWVPADIIELCRLRLAQLHGADAELVIRHPAAVRAGFDETKAAVLLQPGPGRSQRFSAAERAALELAELHAMDPAMITDAVCDEVKRHFGEPGLVALIEAVGLIGARIRLSLLMPQLLREKSS
jgi:hypothetical protein